MDSATEPIYCTSKYGLIVVLKRDGRDSASFELTDVEYTFGRAATCDIRIQVPTIGEMHCRMKRNAKGQMVLQNIDEAGTGLNERVLKGEEEAVLRPGDVITVVERSFRYENPHFASLFPEDLASTAPSTPSRALGAVLDEIVPGSAQKTPRRLLQQQTLSPAKTGFSVTPSNGSPFKAAEGDLTASTPNQFKVTPLKLQEETPKSPKAATPQCTPLPATSKLAQSPINRTPSGSALGSAQKTPRTPRATVPGSPTVVDSEIVASPKFGKGELYEYPKTSLSNEAINQEELASDCIVSATPCAAKTADVQSTLVEAQQAQQGETLIDVEAAPALEVSCEPVANLMDIDLAPITTCPVTEKPDAQETDETPCDMEIVPEETTVNQACADACEPVDQDNQDTCTVEAVEDTQTEKPIQDVDMISATEDIKSAEHAEEDQPMEVTEDVQPVKVTEEPKSIGQIEEVKTVEHAPIAEETHPIEQIQESVAEQVNELVEETTAVEQTESAGDVEMAEAPIETADVVETIMNEQEGPAEATAVEEQITIEEAKEIVEEVQETFSEPIVTETPEPIVEPVAEAVAEATEAPAESTESLIDPDVPAAETGAVNEATAAQVVETVDRTAEESVQIPETEVTVEGDAVAEIVAETVPEIPATTEATPEATEPTPEDLALINSLQKEEMTPRRSTRQSSPFSASRLTAKKTSSGVSTPLKASSTKASLEASPMKENEEIRYVLNVSPKTVAPSSATRSARKTPASTVGRRRRGASVAEEQPEESQSPSLRNKAAAAEEQVDPENMAPVNENENVTTQSARKRGRPRKSETTNDVLTPRAKSARSN